MFGASKFQFSYLKASFAVVYPPSESFLVVEKLTIGSALLCFNHCTAPAVDDFNKTEVIEKRSEKADRDG